MQKGDEEREEAFFFPFSGRDSSPFKLGRAPSLSPSLHPQRRREVAKETTSPRRRSREKVSSFSPSFRDTIRLPLQPDGDFFEVGLGGKSPFPFPRAININAALSSLA